MATSGKEMNQKVQEVASNSQIKVEKVQKVATNNQEMVKKVQEVEQAA